MPPGTGGVHVHVNEPEDSVIHSPLQGAKIPRVHSLGPNALITETIRSLRNREDAPPCCHSGAIPLHSTCSHVEYVGIIALTDSEHFSKSQQLRLSHCFRMADDYLH